MENDIVQEVTGGVPFLHEIAQNIKCSTFVFGFYTVVSLVIASAIVIILKNI